MTQQQTAGKLLLGSKDLSLVEVGRAQTAGFVLLPPDQVPSGCSLRAGLDDAAWQALQQLARRAAGMAVDDPALQACVKQALALLPPPQCDSEALRPQACIGALDPHDAYFRIARTEEDAEAAYLRSLLASLDIFFDEAQAAGGLHGYDCVARAHVDLWCAALGLEVESGLGEPLPAGTPLRSTAAEPVRRWLRGHQIFATVTQGLIWTLHSLQQAWAGGDDEGMRQAMTRVARLYRASAAAFRFTADFDTEVYAQTIRPSMCEPFTPPGFSGSLSSDHARLVGLLSLLRDPLNLAREHFATEHAAMRQALTEVYENHKWVCERFDGASTPSLRTSSRAGECPAVEMLQRFQARRVAQLD